MDVIFQIELAKNPFTLEEIGTSLAITDLSLYRKNHFIIPICGLSTNLFIIIGGIVASFLVTSQFTQQNIFACT